MSHGWNCPSERGHRRVAEPVVDVLEVVDGEHAHASLTAVFSGSRFPRVRLLTEVLTLQIPEPS